MAEQEVIVYRPFLFLIRDIETGTTLYSGHVVNPMIDHRVGPWYTRTETKFEGI